MDVKGIIRDAAALDVRVAVGFGCLCAWSQYLTTFSFAASSNVVASPLVALLLSSWCAVALIAARGWTLRRAPEASRLILAAGLPGTLAGCALLLWPDVPAVVAYAFAVVAGFGVALGFFAWATVFARRDSRGRFGTALAALLVFGLVDGLAALLPHEGLVAVAAACALVSAVAARLDGRRDDGEESGAAAADSPNADVRLGTLRDVKPYRRFSAAYLLYALVFGVTFGVTAFYFEARDGELQSILAGFAPWCLIGGCLLLVAFAVWGDRFNLKALSQVISPLLTVLFLLHILFESSFSSELINATFSLWWIVSVFLFLTLVDVGRRGVFSRPGAFSFGWAAAQTGLGVGACAAQGVSFLVGGLPATANFITACSLILVVVATAMLVGAATPFDVPAASAPGGPVSDGASDADPARDPVVDICRLISHKHALTAREEEVLVLLAQGHTRNGIANKLVVSDNTVRAHVKSIYHKLHIHSKQELVDIVDGYRSAVR